MGRMLGAFDDPQELDRPDLNKCPDCECYFAGDNCPICGKECPPEMRAGNRKPPKKQKRHRGSSRSRVTFIEWYHSWWFITIALIVFPIAGIGLLITSPHKKSSKITFVAIGVVYLVLSTIGIGTIIGAISDVFDPPVNTTLSREEYVGRCQTVAVEDYYRTPDSYKDKFVCLKLRITDVIADAEIYYTEGKYPVYFVCESEDGDRFEILVRNCIQDSAKNFVEDDVITVYGEGNGNVDVYATNERTYSAPCINAAYVTLAPEQ